MSNNHILQYRTKYCIQNPIWGMRTVRIKKHDPAKRDIPSFEHGNVHVYEWYGGDYLGCCGANYFLRSIENWYKS